MIPNVTITRQDGETGVVKPGSDGVLAIIAPSEKGALNLASSFTRGDLAATEFGSGPLVAYASYVLDVAKKPVVLVRAVASTAATYGAITDNVSGTSTLTTSGTPLDSYNAVVRFTGGGTVGQAGITYTYSLDGGRTTSAVQALGMANSITIPGTGITVGLGAGTVVSGDNAAFATTGPRLTGADLTAALEALRVTSLPWEAVLVDSPADDGIVAALDLWLSGLEGVGKFKFGIVNSRPRNVGETEAAYRTAMQAAFSASSSIRVVVAADGGDVDYKGTRQQRPWALGVAARLMAISLSTDAAYIPDGPVKGFFITENGNPKYHDENLFPGLDDLRLTVARTVEGREGAYVNNARLLSPSGSDYVFAQHARVMNRACEVAFDSLTSRLSKGVRRSRKRDPATGNIVIAEDEAQSIENLANSALRRSLREHVTGIALVLSRTDDLSSNDGAAITCELRNAALSYIKKFNVTTKFVSAV